MLRDKINQALAIKSQTEWYRKWRGRLSPNGEGRTMGAMYWQLNDVWQTASWSSIEFGGKWKMLQYSAKKFFQPIIVTGDLDSYGNITINLVNDELQDFENGEVLLFLYRWDSMINVNKTRLTVNVPKESSQEIMKTSVDELIESTLECVSGLAPRGSRCFVKMELRRENVIIHKNLLYPISFKKVEGLQNCSIDVRVQPCDSEVCDIHITSDSICLFVWLDSGDIEGHFSENGFTTTESFFEVRFHSQRAITQDQLQNSLSVTWLDKKKIDTFKFSADISSIFQQIFRRGFKLF